MYSVLMKQILSRPKTESYFPYQRGLLSYCSCIINAIIICKFREGGKKAFPSQIPISPLTMEITAIRVPRCPLIEINGKYRHREDGKHRQAILPLRELDGGGWSEARSPSPLNGWLTSNWNP